MKTTNTNQTTNSISKKYFWKKFFSYYKPYKRLFFSDMLFACIGAGVTLILPLIIRYITSDVIYRAADEALQLILKLSLLMLGLIALEFYCNYFIAYYGHIMGAKMEYDMRNEIFSHYQKLSFSFFDNQKVGQLMSRVTNDLFEISELYHHGPEDIVISIIKLIGSFSILLSIHWQLALIAFAIVPIMLLYAFYFNIKMKKAFVKNRARIADINAQIEDNLSGIRVVKSFANEDIELSKFKKGNDRFVESKKESYRYMGLYNSGLGAFTTLINVIVIASGAFFITRSIISVTDLITFLLYINNFTEPIKKLISFTEQFQNGASGYTRFLEILNVCPDIVDRPKAIELKNAKGDITFQNVSFQYEDTTEAVLSHINLHIKEGEYIALVGTSGVGKSTLCSSLCGLLPTARGEVIFRGRKLSRSARTKQFGMVMQDVNHQLFSDSVKNECLSANPNATNQEIENLLNSFDLLDCIDRHPLTLSGGQRQRLAICQAIMGKKKFLIFDEPTSGLDFRHMCQVTEWLKRLAQHGYILFVVTHDYEFLNRACNCYVRIDKIN